MVGSPIVMTVDWACRDCAWVLIAFQFEFSELLFLIARGADFHVPNVLWATVMASFVSVTVAVRSPFSMRNVVFRFVSSIGMPLG